MRKKMIVYSHWNIFLYTNESQQILLYKNYATKSRGLLKPPFLFIYCLYFRFNITCTAPLSLPSTFFPLVVSKPQNPMVFIISCSSGDFPTRSASATTGRSAVAGLRLGLGLSRSLDLDTDLLDDLACLSRSRSRSLSRSLDFPLSVDLLRRSRDLRLRRSRSLSRSLDRSLLLTGEGERLRTIMYRERQNHGIAQLR